jgi:hypothetical protein
MEYRLRFLKAVAKVSILKDSGPPWEAIKGGPLPLIQHNLEKRRSRGTPPF